MSRENWFTVEKIDDTTYAISEYEHWEETHCYLLCGSQKAALIDTGLGVANIQNVVADLTSLPIEVFTTHVHWDHIGGHKYYEKFAVHKEETEWIATKFPLPLQVVINNLTCKSCNFPESFDISNYQIFQGTPQRILQEGDCIDLGNRELVVIHTPGHSPGHCCFYEPGRKYLYAGDLIYCGCLDAFYPTTDPKLYLQSLRKVKKLDINKILPGHHRLDVPTDIVARMEQAFAKLEQEDKLQHGAGIFEFVDFQIHV